jgi:exo-beta-1,3-glucanase (GH17 family)
MDITETNEDYQKGYLDQMIAWSKKNQVTMFIFEAFDEPWKGGNNPWKLKNIGAFMMLIEKANLGSVNNRIKHL